MKRLHLLLLCGAAFAFNACEKHTAQELAVVDEKFSEQQEQQEKAGAKHETPSGGGQKAGEEAPRFFPAK